MNKEELLKAIEQKRQAIWPTDTGEMKPATVPNNLEQGWLNALTWMEKYINSIPSEKQSNSLDKFIHSLLETYPTNKNEVPIEALNDYHQGLICGARKTYYWQKEQMLKGLCHETKVYRDEEGDGIDIPIESWLALENNEITNLPNIGLKEGDRVKIIIVKEDEQ